MGNMQTQINKLFSDLAALGTGIVVSAATVAIIIGGLMVSAHNRWVELQAVTAWGDGPTC